MNALSHLDHGALKDLKEIMDDDFSLLIETFISDSLLRIGAISQAIEAGDAEQVRTAAHSFKGSSSNICALLLTDLCEDLENMGRENDLSLAKSTYARIREEFEIVKQALEEMIN